MFRDLLARLRSLLTTGLPMEDRYDITAYTTLTTPRSTYVRTVRGCANATAQARALNEARTTTYYTYLVARRYR